jgi:hypothetical protein
VADSGPPARPIEAIFRGIAAHRADRRPSLFHTARPASMRGGVATFEEPLRLID